jgi:hypothetical protein
MTPEHKATVLAHLREVIAADGNYHDAAYMGPFRAAIAMLEAPVADVGAIAERLSAATLEVHDLRGAPSCDSERFGEWDNKPHRVLYDACRLVESLVTDLRSLLGLVHEMAAERLDLAQSLNRTIDREDSNRKRADAAEAKLAEVEQQPRKSWTRAS